MHEENGIGKRNAEGRLLEFCDKRAVRGKYLVFIRKRYEKILRVNVALKLIP